MSKEHKYHLRNDFGINKHGLKKQCKELEVFYIKPEGKKLEELLKRRTQYYTLEEVKEITDWMITDHHDTVDWFGTDDYSGVEVYQTRKYMDKVDRIYKKIEKLKNGKEPEE
tara:strand:+ start:341 stop:676 length:336 start_codon:yes stop_codon:yes gene_type:complete